MVQKVFLNHSYNIKIEIIEENQNNDGDIIISKIIDGINNMDTAVEGSFFDVKNGVYYLYDIKNIFLIRL